MKNHETVIEEMKKRHKGEGDVATKRGAMCSTEVRMDERIVSGLITTADIGIDGICAPGECFDLSYFMDQGIRSVYYGHEYSELPVGKCVTLQTKGTGLWSRTYITKTGLGDDLLTLMSEGIINGLSTGFRIRDAGPPNEHEKRMWSLTDPDAVLVRDALLLEYSIVAMPACPMAKLDEMLTRSAITRASAKFFGLPITTKRTLFPTVEAGAEFAEVIA